MKNLIFGFILASGMAHAENMSLTVSNFNFSYKNPHGEGSATSFTRGKTFTEAVTVMVDKVGEDFKLTVTGAENHEFELKGAPSFMTDAETMTVKGFNLNVNDKLSMSLLQGRFYSKDDELKLDNLSLSCNRDGNQAEAMDQLIVGCIQKMNFNSSKFSTQSTENLVSIFTNSISLALNEGQSSKALGVNNVDLKTNAGKYDLSAEVKAQISGKVKSNGSMSYDPKTGKLSLKISEVKFGILNITGKVFDELRKQESEKLQVKAPYVYFTIK